MGSNSQMKFYKTDAHIQQNQDEINHNLYGLKIIVHE